MRFFFSRLFCSAPAVQKSSRCHWKHWLSYICELDQSEFEVHTNCCGTSTRVLRCVHRRSKEKLNIFKTGKRNRNTAAKPCPVPLVLRRGCMRTCLFFSDQLKFVCGISRHRSPGLSGNLINPELR